MKTRTQKLHHDDSERLMDRVAGLLAFMTAGEATEHLRGEGLEDHVIFHSIAAARILNESRMARLNERAGGASV